MSSRIQPMKDRRGRVYTPAVGPGLRPLLWILLGGFAFLGANGVYLASVTALTWWQGTTQQTFFYMLMVGLHLLFGLLIVVPFLVFGFAHLATSWKRPNKSAVRFGLALLASSLDRPRLRPDAGPRVRHVRGPRPGRPRGRVLAARHRSARSRRSLRQAPPGRPAHQVGMGSAPGRRRRSLRGRHGVPSLEGPAIVRGQRSAAKGASISSRRRPSPRTASSSPPRP